MNVRALLVGLLTLALASGCGFHLRRYQLDANVGSIYVDAARGVDIAGPLRQALRQLGVAEAADARSAELTVELADQRAARRTVSVTGQARAAEYESSYGVLYRLAAGETELLPAEWVERQRVFSVDRNSIVGSGEEQSIVERELRDQVLQQIIRSIDLVSRQREAATPNAAVVGDGAG